MEIPRRQGELNASSKVNIYVSAVARHVFEQLTFGQRRKSFDVTCQRCPLTRLLYQTFIAVAWVLSGVPVLCECESTS